MDGNIIMIIILMVVYIAIVVLIIRAVIITEYKNNEFVSNLKGSSKYSDIKKENIELKTKLMKLKVQKKYLKPIRLQSSVLHWDSDDKIMQKFVHLGEIDITNEPPENIAYLIRKLDDRIMEIKQRSDTK